MKQDFSQIKNTLDKAKNRVKDFANKYYKIAGSAVVATALCAVCSVSLLDKLSADNDKKGVMISLADVKANEKTLPEGAFDISSVSYTDMQNMLYETEQLAKLETSEKQFEEILSSNNKNKTVYYELTAQTVNDAVAVPAVATSNRPSVTTYADENGTYQYVGDFILTAYCSCPICCGIYSNVENPTTASGTTATQGRTIAADTSVFPFGTQLVINGQVYTVEDRGGAIVGNRIDVYFNSHQEALQFGRQTAPIYIQVD